MGLLFLIDERIKENPTHFKEVDGERFVRKSLSPLGNKDAAGVGWIAAVEGEQQIQGWEAKAIDLRAAAWARAGN